MIRRKSLDAAYRTGWDAAMSAPDIPHNAGMGETWTKYHQWAHASGHAEALRTLTRYYQEANR